uniref:NADH-ubiquinone oxidoreductase chain 2 n=1 Tax=Neuroctenus yunnanensis TaxID=2813420 RepID=A0A8T9W025_9HEMI|nr:NADH dehydrogenase subunit 2 [Neuroctenus yunnanensis]UPI55390.1 NADH dehydrogenase subunit 2 [Neuroctenus yunnanensis]
MKINTQMITIYLLSVSTVMVLTSKSWMGMWIGMEINMIGFVPLLKAKNKESSSSSMIYFLTQSMGSSLMLYSLLSMWFQSPSGHSSLMMTMMMASIMIKMGLPPMHMWMIYVLNNSSWSCCFILLTWQKVAPLTVMYHLNQTINETMTMAMMTTIIGSIGGINHTSIRKIMGYSSVSHMGWMMITLNNINKCTMYFIIYTIMVYTMCQMLETENMFYLNQFMLTNKINKIAITLNMLSMGGLPPMIGFLPKWIAIQTMINNNLVMIASIMTMTSLITLMVYMNMISPMMTMSNTMNKTAITTEKDYSRMIIISMMTPLALSINILM